MYFENIAYIFDSLTCVHAEKNSVHSIISYVCNPLYITTYAKNVVKNFDLDSYINDDFKEWINVQKNKDALIPFLMKFIDDSKNFGMSSIFIEKEYATFIYLLGLMCSSIEIYTPSISANLDKLYSSYKSTYGDQIIQGDILNTITMFNEHVSFLLNANKEFQFFKMHFTNNHRSLDEQLAIVNVVEKSSDRNLMIADYFFYTNQYLKVLKEKNVHTIYASQNAAKRFTEAIDDILERKEIKLNYGDINDEDYLSVLKLSKILLILSNYIINLVVSAKTIDDLTDHDKHLFVLTWLIFQGGECNMLFNGHVNEIIQSIFMSLKTEITF